MIEQWPTSAGEVLDTALGVWRKHGLAVARVTAIPVLAAGFCQLSIDALIPPSVLHDVAGITIPLAVLGIAEGLALTQLGDALGLAYHESTPWKRVRTRLSAIVLAYVVKWLVIVGGLFLLLIPGGWLTVRWFAVPTVFVFEEIRWRDGFRRSRDLARGKARFLLATVVVFEFAYLLLTIGVFAAFSPEWGTGRTSGLATVVDSLLNLAVLPLRTAVALLAYAAIRVTREGLDLDGALSRLSPVGVQSG